MTTRSQKGGAQFVESALRLFAVNERMNQVVIEHLDHAVWTAKAPGNVRTIAAIFTHIHNVRTKWIRLTAPHLGIPAQLNRAHCTQEQARAGLAASAAGCAEMLTEVLDGNRAMFRRDALASPWPTGPEMLTYMVAHEAHHRGQVCMLAHQLGFPLPGKVVSRMWSWERL